jgi:hypothetical protein
VIARLLTFLRSLARINVARFAAVPAKLAQTAHALFGCVDDHYPVMGGELIFRITVIVIGTLPVAMAAFLLFMM